MKMIVVDNSLDVTGAFKALFCRIGSSNRDPECLYFIPKGSKNAGLLRSKGITVYTFTSYELTRRPLNIFLYIPYLLWNGFRLARIVRKHRIDVVYQNEVFILSGIVAKLFVRVKVLTHIRVMPTIFPVRLFRLWLQLQDRFSEKLFTSSFACAAAARGVYPIRKDLEVIYGFVPPQPVLPVYATRDCRKAGRLVFVGNYTKGKGQDLALKAVQLLMQRHPNYDVRIQMFGSDFGYPSNIAFRECLKSYIRDNGMESVAQLCDFAEDVERIMKGGDLLLNLSIAESFSWVVAEALWFGIPVIATDSGGPGELIEHDVSGLLVSSEASIVADRIWELLQSSEKRRGLSDRGRERIVSLLEQFGAQDLAL